MGRSEVKAGSRKLLVSGVDSDPYIVFTVLQPITESTKMNNQISKI
jgi:hypothetical protein